MDPIPLPEPPPKSALLEQIALGEMEIRRRGHNLDALWRQSAEQAAALTLAVAQIEPHLMNAEDLAYVAGRVYGLAHGLLRTAHRIQFEVVAAQVAREAYVAWRDQPCPSPAGAHEGGT